MDWGVLKETMDPNTLRKLCLEEIEDYQLYSMGPYYIVSVR